MIIDTVEPFSAAQTNNGSVPIFPEKSDSGFGKFLHIRPVLYLAEKVII
jgi:hypothetical protein